MNKLDFLDNVFTKLVRAKYLVAPEPQATPVRCSALPFCRVELAMNIMTDDIRKNKKQEKISFMQDFYFSMGTTMHSVVQKWLARIGMLYGVFVCDNPKCKGKDNIKSKGVGPFTCPKCGQEMIYEEFTLRAPEGLVGHTDGLIPYKDGFILFELKSIIARRLEEDDLPYFHNIVQVNAYGVICQKYKGLKIYGAVILYLTRDSHRNYKFFLINKLDMKMFDETIDDIIAVNTAIDTGNFSKVTRSCDDIENAGSCRYRFLCFKGKIKNHLKRYHKILL